MRVGVGSPVASTIASTAANFIDGVKRVARARIAPRNRPGNASTLFT